ncbi:MAG: hypothetical protein EZS28_021240 [Streblomastix strix]|uniref:Uncharacterized protein n=1 Tax=Streblomastix strix TaxID=222440 RepID=A0A5J4VLX0_9EUKA|nr:MAG: hypothetical protein EZS28_021240 [Streblomastix strix]
MDAKERKIREETKIKDKELEDELEENCTFAPELNANSMRILEDDNIRDDIERVPLHERAAILQRQKAEKLTMMRIELERSDPNLTHVPFVSKQSLEVIQKAPRLGPQYLEKDVITRMAESDKRVRDEKKHLQAEKRKEEETTKYTFTPQINPLSQQLVEQNVLYQGQNSDFIERQKILSEKSAHEKILAEKLYKENLRFKPRTTVDLILELESTEEYEKYKRKRNSPQRRGSPNKQDRDNKKYKDDTDNQQVYEDKFDFWRKLKDNPKLHETLEERIERLAHQDVQMRKQKTKELQDQAIIIQKPEISKMSQILAERMDRYPVEDDLPHKQALAKEKDTADKEFKRLYTFRPHINENSRILMGEGTGSQGTILGDGRSSVEQSTSVNNDQRQTLLLHIEQSVREKELALERERRKREYEEMRNCTFKPELSKKVKAASTSPKGPIYIRGLMRHLELQDTARRMEAERRSTEDRVLQPRKPIRPPTPHEMEVYNRLSTPSNPRRIAMEEARERRALNISRSGGFNGTRNLSSTMRSRGSGIGGDIERFEGTGRQTPLNYRNGQQRNNRSSLLDDSDDSIDALIQEIEKKRRPQSGNDYQKGGKENRRNRNENTRYSPGDKVHESASSRRSTNLGRGREGDGWYENEEPWSERNTKRRGWAITGKSGKPTYSESISNSGRKSTSNPQMILHTLLSDQGKAVWETEDDVEKEWAEEISRNKRRLGLDKERQEQQRTQLEEDLHQAARIEEEEAARREYEEQQRKQREIAEQEKEKRRQEDREQRRQMHEQRRKEIQARSKNRGVFNNRRSSSSYSSNSPGSP